MILLFILSKNFSTPILTNDKGKNTVHEPKATNYMYITKTNTHEQKTNTIYKTRKYNEY